MRNALGKGLARLIGESQSETVREIRLSSISLGESQPRRRFAEESLQELADSIREVGVLQPIIVRPLDAQRFEIVAGERRFRAAQLAGLDSIPAIVRGLDDRQSLQIALIENVQREDISPIEAAEAYQRLSTEFGLTQEEIAQSVGKSRPAIANTIRLLRLPSEIRSALEAGSITEGHARALLQLDTDTEMLAAFKKLVEKGATVREAERISRGGNGKQARPLAPNPTELETAISERIGAPSRIKRKGKGGAIEIAYFSEDDLAGILDRLGVSL
jgi:ParB family chromosome partitioning protein